MIKWYYITIKDIKDMENTTDKIDGYMYLTKMLDKNTELVIRDDTFRYYPDSGLPIPVMQVYILTGKKFKTCQEDVMRLSRFCYLKSANDAKMIYEKVNTVKELDKLVIWRKEYL
jgi:hypothetical protein